MLIKKHLDNEKHGQGSPLGKNKMFSTDSDEEEAQNAINNADKDEQVTVITP
jgi:hypothetical protein